MKQIKIIIPVILGLTLFALVMLSITATIEPEHRPAYAADGITASSDYQGPLDPTFDGDGIVTTTIGSYDTGRAVAIQEDGKIVVAGYTGAIPNVDFALARYTITGTLDTSFNTDGKLTTNFGDRDYGFDVVIQNDGKIIAAGSGGGIVDSNFALARYTITGTLDTTFSDDGKVLTSVGASTQGRGVGLQEDGKIVVVGYVGTTSHDFALARYTITGTLDTSFNTDGMLTTDLGGDEYGYAVAFQADGKIVAAGYSGGDFGLARYTITGTLDATFGTNGIVTTDLGDTEYGYDLTIQEDGKILVAGESGPNFALARYTITGTLDTTFNTDGIVTTDFGGDDSGHSLAIQKNGKIVVAGYKYDDDALFALARYNNDGSLDTSFGSAGRVTTDIKGNDGRGYGMALQPDGKVVVVGYSEWNFALVCYTEADLAVTKRVVPAAVAPGESVSYVLTISNTSVATATNVVLTDTIPISITNTSVSSSGVTITDTGYSPVYVWQVQEMGPGESGTITLTGNLIVPLKMGEFTNSVTISTTGIDINPNNNSSDVSLTINNAAPVALNLHTSTDEDIPISGSVSASDGNADALSFSLVTLPTNGGASMDIDGSFNYTPTLNLNGHDTFTFWASDGIASSNVATVAITINPVNDPPLITSQLPLITPRGTALTIVLTDLIVSDLDNAYPDGFTLEVQDGVNYTRQGATITPVTGYLGMLTVPVRVNDGIDDSNLFGLQVKVSSELPNVTFLPLVIQK